MYFVYLFVFAWCLVSARERVDIVTYSEWLIPHALTPYRYALIQDHFEVNFYTDIYNYVVSFKGDEESLRKILFYEYRDYLDMSALPHTKTICFKWEAIKINPELYRYYYRIYTFDDDLVDNGRYFKFYYPVLQPMLTDIPSFTEKKLCAMVVGNWFSERIQILDFFAEKPADSLHAYGLSPEKYADHPMLKGKIPGFHSGKEKIDVLKHYKFSICFENTHTTPGYITEKIFDAFAAGCVPIYWGPNNVEKYIPTDCFIDYRTFKDNEEMYQFITSMTEAEYERYLERIRVYLGSEMAQLFSLENFEETIFQAVTN